MLSSEDHPGLFTITAGVVVLVFLGVGLSLLADKRSVSGKGKEAVQREIRHADEEIAHMKADKVSQEQHIESLGRRSARAKASYTTVSAQLKEQDERLSSLLKKLDALRQEVPRIENDFEAYRAEYRNTLWTSSTGQPLGVLRTRDGKMYRQAVIRRVTSTSLDITFDQGTVSIPASNLEKLVQDRFQWTENELKMAERRAAGQPPPAVTPGPAKKTPLPPAVDPVRLSNARAAVRALNERVNQIETQLAEARNAAASGKRSIPGSLDTWQARAERLSQSLVRARTELAAAKANLAEIHSTDPLTR